MVLENFFEEGDVVCKSYVKKLRSNHSKKFDFNVYNSMFTELLSLYLFCINDNFKNLKGRYEPQNVLESDKNPEYEIIGWDKPINVEVKTLNFRQSFDRVLKDAFDKNVYIFKEYFPLKKEEKEVLRCNLMVHSNLDINKMIAYGSEWRKINNNIKNANKKFNSKNYNILIINYNAGLDFDEPIRCILDEKEGILNKTQNAQNIDAIILVSLSENCYNLIEYKHFFDNAYVIMNNNRDNSKLLKDLLINIGYNKFVEGKLISDKKWRIYKIIVFSLGQQKSQQYIVVPYENDEASEIKKVIDFMVPDNLKDKDFEKCIEKLSFKTTNGIN